MIKYRTNESSSLSLFSTLCFKHRPANHSPSFMYSDKWSTTTLSSYVWDLKDKGVDFNLEWRFIGRAKTFSTVSEICNLCTLEKYHILFTPQMATLNKKEEINNWCPHKKDILLDKT